MFRPPSSLAFFPGSGGGFALAWTPAAPGKMQTNSAAPLGGRPLAFISSRETSRGRPPLITRDDSPYGLAARVKADGRDRFEKIPPPEKPAAAGRPSRGMTARSRAGGSREQTALRILGKNVGAGYRRPSSASVGYRRKRAAANCGPRSFLGGAERPRLWPHAAARPSSSRSLPRMKSAARWAAPAA